MRSSKILFKVTMNFCERPTAPQSIVSLAGPIEGGKSDQKFGEGQERTKNKVRPNKVQQDFPHVKINFCEYIKASWGQICCKL